MELTLEQALQKGVEAHKAGKVQEADRYYTAILKANPKHCDANHNMGVLAVGVGKVEQALPFFKIALEVNSSIAQFWLSYIEALIKLDRTVDAKAVFDQAKSKGVKGDGFDQLEERLEGVKPSETTAAQNQEPRAKDQDLTKDQFKPVMNLYSQGQHQKALDMISQLLQKFPNSVNLYNIQGAANAGIYQYDAAIDSYKKAIDIKPDYADAYNNLGNAHNELGEFEKAIEIYNKVLLIKPDFAEGFNSMGNALKVQGKLDEAVKAYKKALAIKPDYGEAKHILSSLTGETTNSAPRDYVENLFDDYANKFDNSLLQKLEYKIPKTLSELAVKEHGSGSLGSILDLGCGTGLTGLELKDFCSYLEGIDLSYKMLEQAKIKKIYDKLTHVDITEYLLNAELNFNYFFSTDVFIYLGDLSDVFRLIKTRNKNPGRLIFSTEHSERNGFQLEKSGRYSHSYRYIVDQRLR